MPDLLIGQLAASAGVSVDTVRFYERRGLLPRARRARSGYRVFDHGAVERLKLIRSLTELHVELDEVAAMLTALSGDAASCSRERPRLAAALERTDAKLAALLAVRERLHDALQRCDAGKCDLPSRVRGVDTRQREHASLGPRSARGPFDVEE